MSRAALLLWLAAGTAWAIPEGPEPNTPEWFAREAQNYARTLEAPAEQALNPAFLQRLEQQSLANQTGYNARLTGDPSWFAFPSGNTPLTPLCSTWMEQCAGDPFRYAGVAGADGAAFYDGEAEVVPFVIYDDGCARLSGRVWSPRGQGSMTAPRAACPAWSSRTARSRPRSRFTGGSRRRWCAPATWC
jgi:hypothetical protein